MRDSPPAPGSPPFTVDDNEDASQPLAEKLELAGHDVQVAVRRAVGAEAGLGLGPEWDLAPEVILMDIGLPVMDGYELARAIREMPEIIPPRMIALTGYAQESDRVRAIEASFAEHLVKPNLGRLLSAIHTSIGRAGRAARGSSSKRRREVPAPNPQILNSPHREARPSPSCAVSTRGR